MSDVTTQSVTVAASAEIRVGPCFLMSVIPYDITGAGSIIIYDNATASGTTRFYVTFTGAASSVAFLVPNVRFTAGMYVAVTNCKCTVYFGG